MASLFRSALMWLLLLSLPLQGYAAAAMLHCGPSHQQTSTPSSAKAAQVHGAHHSQVANANHGESAAPSSGHAEGHDEAPAGHHGGASEAKCSACAACCMGAGLPASLPTFLSFPPAAAPVAGACAAHVDFVSSGPERPPRLLFSV